MDFGGWRSRAGHVGKLTHPLPSLECAPCPLCCSGSCSLTRPRGQTVLRLSGRDWPPRPCRKGQMLASGAEGCDPPSCEAQETQTQAPLHVNPATCPPGVPASLSGLPAPPHPPPRQSANRHQYLPVKGCREQGREVDPSLLCPSRGSQTQVSTFQIRVPGI